MKRAVLTLVLFAAIVAPYAAVSPARACYCAEPDLAQRVDQADVIMTGTVEGYEGGRAVLAVDRYLLGDGDRELLLDDYYPSDCSYFNGLEMHVGHRYLVFAFVDGLSVHTGLCMGNVPLDANPEGEMIVLQVRALTGDNPLAVQLPGGSTGSEVAQAEDTTTSDPLAWVLIIGGGIALPVAFLLGASFVSRRGAGH